jgi:hypothetical protein
MSEEDIRFILKTIVPYIYNTISDTPLTVPLGCVIYLKTDDPEEFPRTDALKAKWGFHSHSQEEFEKCNLCVPWEALPVDYDARPTCETVIALVDRLLR